MDSILECLYRKCRKLLIYGVDTDQNTVTRSNELFANILGRYIDGDDVLENVKAEYFIENDPVITFNRERLYNT